MRDEQALQRLDQRTASRFIHGKGLAAARTLYLGGVEKYLNDAELKEFTALIEKRKQKPSELIRELIFREIRRDQEGVQASPELIEIIGTRLLLVNGLEPLLTATNAMSKERLHSLLDQISKVKYAVAQEKVKEAQGKP